MYAILRVRVFQAEGRAGAQPLMKLSRGGGQVPDIQHADVLHCLGYLPPHLPQQGQGHGAHGDLHFGFECWITRWYLCPKVLHCSDKNL